MRTLSRSKKSLLTIGLVCACLMVVGLVLVPGCGKKEETKPPESGAELWVNNAMASVYAKKGIAVVMVSGTAPEGEMTYAINSHKVDKDAEGIKGWDEDRSVPPNFQLSFSMDYQQFFEWVSETGNPRFNVRVGSANASVPIRITAQPE